MGIDAAGKTTVATIVEIDRVVDGKIVESWGEFSGIDVLRQLGVLPAAAGEPHS